MNDAIKPTVMATPEKHDPFLGRSVPLYCSAGLLLAFTVYFLFKGNYEFLTYTVSIGILIYLLLCTDRIFRYPLLALWGFALWLFLHMAGGSFFFGGVRLYDFILIPLTDAPLHLLRYDQVVHSFCYFVITLLTYALVNSIVAQEAKAFLVMLITFLAGIGIGAINEIIEFSTVVFFGSTGVGDYYNNAMDLVFNGMGALVAVIMAYTSFYRR